MWKKTWVKVMFVIFIVWLIISAYYYRQHCITIRNYIIDKQIELKDVKVEIKEVSLRTSNRKRNNNYRIPKSYELMYKFAQRFEDPMRALKIMKPLFQIPTFYSKPYEVNDELLTLKLRGKFISDKFKGKDREQLIEDIKVDVIDESGADHSSSSRWQYEEGNNIVPFEISGNLFPIDRINNELTIVVTDKKNNITKKFRIEPEYVTRNYNFFDKKINLDAHPMC
ncbi:hypothetical protein EV214_108120 [Marinisporobacter balticus]|uniref:Uncharacterized protein n=2 Tax=Marinisporobacter balticus TaxID=2018667 RepID=A0A4R2KUM0_9FIRM|nr:hypothetical protein EV214_108120 [Marinisporobacter balticus]